MQKTINFCKSNPKSCKSSDRFCKRGLALARPAAFSLLTLCLSARTKPRSSAPAARGVHGALRLDAPRRRGLPSPRPALLGLRPAMLAASPPWGPSGPPPTAAPPATNPGLARGGGSGFGVCVSTWWWLGQAQRAVVARHCRGRRSRWAECGQARGQGVGRAWAAKAVHPLSTPVQGPLGPSACPHGARQRTVHGQGAADSAWAGRLFKTMAATAQTGPAPSPVSRTTPCAPHPRSPPQP